MLLLDEITFLLRKKKIRCQENINPIYKHNILGQTKFWEYCNLATGFINIFMPKKWDDLV